MASASESDSASEISLELSSQSVSFDDGSEGSEEKGHRETAQQPVRGPGVVM